MTTIESINNVFDISSFDYSKNNEIIHPLIQSDNIRIEHIVSYGQISDNWYDQHENEWVVLLQGNATICYENKTEISLYQGDTLYIPAHQKHKVSFTSTHPPCIWLAIFFIK